MNEYKLTGLVIRLDAQHRLAVIKHQRIEEWMGAMTMELRASVFVRPADLEYWIANVVILDEAGKEESK